MCFLFLIKKRDIRNYMKLYFSALNNFFSLKVSFVHSYRVCKKYTYLNSCKLYLLEINKIISLKAIIHKVNQSNNLFKIKLIK